MWTISELTELMNLSRRDIQRLCYSDGHNGGLGLLDPEDSTQGRRHFSDDDVKVLFVVSQYKGLGMTLPEAAERVRKAREDGADTKALVSDLVSELERKRDAIERRLAFAKAIEGSTLGRDWDALVFAASAVPLLEGASRLSWSPWRRPAEMVVWPKRSCRILWPIWIVPLVSCAAVDCSRPEGVYPKPCGWLFRIGLSTFRGLTGLIAEPLGGLSGRFSIFTPSA